MRIAIAGGTGVVGRYAVAAAQQAGHSAIVISRSAGIDLRSDEQVATALNGVDVIINASNAATLSRDKATQFFVEAADRLQRLGVAQGVTHLVTLSIVGIDRVQGFGYYEAKRAQEAAVTRGALPHTIVRATQFHEFAAQILGRTRLGPVAFVPKMRVQTVAARTVGRILVELAAAVPNEAIVEVGGPAVGDLVVLARASARRLGHRMAVVPLILPDRASRAMRSGALLPGEGARLEGPSFAEWLESPDATVVQI